MGKQVGPTPITAKLKRTTKGGIVQPQLKTLQSPAQKALVGKQHNLPQHLKAKIEAAPESPAKNRANRAAANESRIKARAAAGAAKEGAKKALELKKAEELASKEFISNRRGRKVKNPAYQAQTIQPVKQTSGNKTGSTKANLELKDVLERKGIDVSSYKGDTRGKMKKGTYRYAKASQPGLDGIISKRNKAMKGTAEYNRYQNQINKAYGVGPTNRSTTEKTVSTIKPKTTKTSKPTASTEIKNTTKNTTKKTTTSAKASKLRAKGEKALAEGKVAKAQRLRKRYDRKTKRDKRKAERKEKRSIRKN